jgi:hypothetical protein
MELIHSCFDGSGVEVQEISCTDDENKSSQSDEVTQVRADSHEGQPELNEDDLDELDEFETGVYLCRWPNGECSVVVAGSRRDAILMLDEWGGAHPSYVHPIESFMADFGLTERGEIKLLIFGEETRELIWKTCYPDLDALLLQDDVTDDAGNLLPKAESRVRDAVAHEQSRRWDSQPNDEPSTELGKSLARQMGTSAVVADSYIKTAAKKILKSKLGEEGEPN